MATTVVSKADWIPFFQSAGFSPFEVDHFAALFFKHQICESMLPKLTIHFLQAMGIGVVGHMIMILERCQGTARPIKQSLVGLGDKTGVSPPTTAAAVLTPEERTADFGSAPSAAYQTTVVVKAEVEQINQVQTEVAAGRSLATSADFVGGEVKKEDPLDGVPEEVPVDDGHLKNRITDGSSQNVLQGIRTVAKADPHIRSTAEKVSDLSILETAAGPVASRSSNDGISKPAIVVGSQPENTVSSEFAFNDGVSYDTAQEAMDTIPPADVGYSTDIPEIGGCMDLARDVESSASVAQIKIEPKDEPADESLQEEAVVHAEDAEMEQEGSLDTARNAVDSSQNGQRDNSAVTTNVDQKIESAEENASDQRMLKTAVSQMDVELANDGKSPVCDSTQPQLPEAHGLPSQGFAVKAEPVNVSPSANQPLQVAAGGNFPTGSPWKSITSSSATKRQESLDNAQKQLSLPGSFGRVGAAALKAKRKVASKLARGRGSEKYPVFGRARKRPKRKQPQDSRPTSYPHTPSAKRRGAVESSNNVEHQNSLTKDGAGPSSCGSSPKRLRFEVSPAAADFDIAADSSISERLRKRTPKASAADSSRSKSRKSSRASGKGHPAATGSGSTAAASGNVNPPNKVDIKMKVAVMRSDCCSTREKRASKVDSTRRSRSLNGSKSSSSTSSSSKCNNHDSPLSKHPIGAPALSFGVKLEEEGGSPVAFSAVHGPTTRRDWSEWVKQNEKLKQKKDGGGSTLPNLSSTRSNATSEVTCFPTTRRAWSEWVMQNEKLKQKKDGGGSTLPNLSSTRSNATSEVTFSPASSVAASDHYSSSSRSKPSAEQHLRAPAASAPRMSSSAPESPGRPKSTPRVDRAASGTDAKQKHKQKVLGSSSESALMETLNILHQHTLKSTNKGCLLLTLEPLDLVWAQIKSHLWYPGLLIDPNMPRIGLFQNEVAIPIPPLALLSAKNRNVEPGYPSLLVILFDKKETWTWVSRCKLEPLGVDMKLDKSKLSCSSDAEEKALVRKAYAKAIEHRCKVTGESADSPLPDSTTDTD